MAAHRSPASVVDVQAEIVEEVVAAALPSPRRSTLTAGSLACDPSARFRGIDCGHPRLGPSPGGLASRVPVRAQVRGGRRSERRPGGVHPHRRGAPPAAHAEAKGKMTAGPLLDVRDLTVDYPVRHARTPYRAVDSVSLSNGPGETLGRWRVRLGQVHYLLCPLGLRRSPPALIRGPRHHPGNPAQRGPCGKDLQVVFQGPYSSLNRPPRPALSEPLEVRRYCRPPAP